MDKFVTKTKRLKTDLLSTTLMSNPTPITIQTTSIPNSTPSPQTNSTSNTDELEADPGKRLPILDITKNPTEIENLRRAYLLKGPCQPILKNFPQSTFGLKKRKFIVSWYKQFGDWLEYSVEKDAVFCLYCYLFYLEIGNSGGRHDSFAASGFRHWNKKKRLARHVGDHGSVHNQCYHACQDLLNRKQHIDIAFGNFSEQSKMDYRVRLVASLDIVRHLLRMGHAFRGHDESESSNRRGQFIETLKLTAKRNEEIRKVVLENAPKNNKLTSPDIQKDLAEACASLTLKKILGDIGDDFFTLLVDEARDSSIKEQMSVVLRYVDQKGYVLERFVGVVHVSDTTSKSLKIAIDGLFSKLGLSMKKCRGQGYDGASNMQGEFKGLKSLILQENPCAFYIHCFCHQLQLALVKVAKSHDKIEEFFYILSKMATVIGGSCKRKDYFRDEQYKLVVKRIACEEVETGKGLNQEATFKRPGDTRWSSHYATILSLINLFSPVRSLMDAIRKEPKNEESRGEARSILFAIEDFEFIFILHFMSLILGKTFCLSESLQKKDQDLVNAMNLVNVAKDEIQHVRDHEFDTLIEEASEFCKKHDIDVPNMKDSYCPKGRSRRRAESISFSQYLKVEYFYMVIDSQLYELNDRFNKVNTKLIECLSCLDPRNSFMAFDKKKLIEFAKFYPMEFNDTGDLQFLSATLDTFIRDVRGDLNFSNLKGIGELAQKMIEKGKDITFPLVYLLVKLALLLPVTTATVERTFCAMKYIKNDLRNRMGDSWLNDSMITYIEHEIFDTIEDDAIIDYFQKMKERRMLVP